MSFETRCPECRTKLRLEEVPRKSEPIECPKCGSLFIPPKAAAAEAAARVPEKAGKSRGEKVFADEGPPKLKSKSEKIFADDDDEDRTPRKPAKKAPAAEKPVKKAPGKSIAVKKDVNPNNKGKRRNVKKRKTNPAVLLLSLAVGFLGLAGVFYGMTYLLGRAGGVQQMLVFVPGDANWIRGINVSNMAKFPGYADQVNKFKTVPVNSACDELAKTSGLNSEGFLDYLMIAKTRTTSGTGTIYLFRTSASFDVVKMQTGLTGGTPTNVNGVDGVKFNNTGPGILANSTMLMPTTRIIAIVMPGPQSNTLAVAVAAGKASPDGSFLPKLNATSKQIIKGSIWLIMRNTGALQNYMDASLAPVSTDFKALYEKGKTAETFGVWTLPGGSGVRVGAAFSCADKKSAADLVKYMKDGPLGKEDESEPTNQMKSAGIQFLLDKKTFGEFMQYCKFVSNQECAFVTSTVSGENAKRLMDAFNSATMGSDEGGGGFQPTFGPPGGGGGRPPQVGLPGGIATPGG